MDLINKYIFKPYSKTFPELFKNEKSRLQKVLGKNILIEHVGSTAVPGLGGKGVIDILIAVPQKSWPETSDKLKGVGYDYRKKDAEREKERLFFMATLPDPETGSRIYHIHLTYPGSLEVARMTKFRDYLIAHPEDIKKYSEVKKLAAKEAQKLSTKDEMRDKYGAVKQEFIENIYKKLDIKSWC